MKKMLLIVVVLVILVPICTIQVKKYLFEKRVEHYLTEMQSYDKEEIQVIETEWHFAGLPSFSVNVIFADEPYVIYLYFAHDKEKVHQVEAYFINDIASTVPLKHLESQ